MNQRKKSFYRNRLGQSLVSVLVAGGVGAIVVGFITDMLVQQGISQKFLSQKMEINDLTNSIISTFSKASNCTCQFAAADNPNAVNYAGLTFDSNDNSGNQFINIKKLYSGCAGVGPLVLAGEGEMLSPSSSLRVNTVRLVNLRRASSQTEWQGQWEISFQYGAGSAVRSVKPVLVTQKFTIDNGASANARITVCNGLSTGTGTQDHLAKWSPTPGVIQDSGVVEDTVTGNVGIGTTTPGAPLHVVGASARIDRSTIAADAGPALDFFNNATHIGQIVSTLSGVDGSALSFYTKTSGGNLGPPKLSIDNAGNVGIGTGTTTPNASLNVRGNTTETNNANGRLAGIIAEGDGNWGGGIASKVSGAVAGGLGPRFIGYSSRGTLAAPTVTQVNNNLLVMAGLGYTGSSYTANGNGFLEIVADDNFSATSTPTRIGLWTTPTGSTGAVERIRINNAGNVGIGTVSPTVNLDVNGAIRPGSDSTVTACNSGAAAGEGSLRYNYTLRRMEYCNGSGWVSALGGGSIDWKNPNFRDSKSGTASTGYNYGSTYSLCMVVGTGTNAGGCYMLDPNNPTNPSPGNWYLSFEAYPGLNTNCLVSCWN